MNRTPTTTWTLKGGRAGVVDRGRAKEGERRGGGVGGRDAVVRSTERERLRALRENILKNEIRQRNVN